MKALLPPFQGMSTFVVTISSSLGKISSDTCAVKKYVAAKKKSAFQKSSWASPTFLCSIFLMARQDVTWIWNDGCWQHLESKIMKSKIGYPALGSNINIVYYQYGYNQKSKVHIINSADSYSFKGHCKIKWHSLWPGAERVYPLPSKITITVLWKCEIVSLGSPSSWLSNNILECSFMELYLVDANWTTLLFFFCLPSEVKGSEDARF